VALQKLQRRSSKSVKNARSWQQREELSETVRDLANLQFAALVLGQVVGDGPVSWGLVLIGSTFWLAFVAVALLLSWRKRWSARS